MAMMLVNPLPETEAFSPATAATSRFLCGRRWGRNIAHSGIASGRMDKMWMKGRGAQICGYAHGSAHDAVEHEEVCFHFLSPGQFARLLFFERERLTLASHVREQDAALEAVEWTAEITGDKKFDTAWMAAWKSKDRIRCPFFKRRATDVLEAALAVGRFILARHKSLLRFAPNSKGGAKMTGLSAAALLQVVRSDFEQKRYYVTGKLTREVYRYAHGCWRMLTDAHVCSRMLTSADASVRDWQPDARATQRRVLLRRTRPRYARPRPRKIYRRDIKALRAARI